MKLREILKYADAKDLVKVIPSVGESAGALYTEEIKDEETLDTYVLVRGMNLLKGLAKDVVSPDSLAWKKGMSADDEVVYMSVEVV
jgi:hypothetical protein